mmetsp:Transcript_73321/g.218855  ORF Transcript_73321/g.218855 Transcript_73321/m.218855 type:complete len:113 (-) Transcript_73321:964-1302(-)
MQASRHCAHQEFFSKHCMPELLQQWVCLQSSPVSVHWLASSIGTTLPGAAGSVPGMTPPASGAIGDGVGAIDGAIDAGTSVANGGEVTVGAGGMGACDAVTTVPGRSSKVKL